MGNLRGKNSRKDERKKGEKCEGEKGAKREKKIPGITAEPSWGGWGQEMHRCCYTKQEGRGRSLGRLPVLSPPNHVTSMPLSESPGYPGLAMSTHTAVLFSDQAGMQLQSLPSIAA